jgi:hypothetical protein
VGKGGKASSNEETPKYSTPRCSKGVLINLFCGSWLFSDTMRFTDGRLRVTNRHESLRRAVNKPVFAGVERSMAKHAWNKLARRGMSAATTGEKIEAYRSLETLETRTRFYLENGSNRAALKFGGRERRRVTKQREEISGLQAAAGVCLEDDTSGQIEFVAGCCLSTRS